MTSDMWLYVPWNDNVIISTKGTDKGSTSRGNDRELAYLRKPISTVTLSNSNNIKALDLGTRMTLDHALTGIRFQDQNDL